MKNIVIIPARMGSSRFYGKPLADICGKPMIRRVCERASMAKGISEVIVATCDKEIMEVVEDFGGNVVMTSDKHRSGTDRLAEVAEKTSADIIVNVQGDEPLIEPRTIETALNLFDGTVNMASLMVAIDAESAKDPNIVKVVVDKDFNALYFSRSSIPFERNPITGNIYAHIGLYAYTKDFLMKFSKLPQNPLEKAESLEQLRVLENGYKIKMAEVSEKPFGVDTPQDLERVRKIISGGNL